MGILQALRSAITLLFSSNNLEEGADLRRMHKGASTAAAPDLSGYRAGPVPARENDAAELRTVKTEEGARRVIRLRRLDRRTAARIKAVRKALGFSWEGVAREVKIYGPDKGEFLRKVLAGEAKICDSTRREINYWLPFAEYQAGISPRS
jgi:hypothetical protein